MNYITQADYQAYRDVTLTGNGLALFNLLLPSMQAMVDQYLNRSFNITNPITEYFNLFEDTYSPKLKDTFFPKYSVDSAPFNNAFPRAGGINSVTFGEVNGTGGTSIDLTYVYSYKTFIKISTWNAMISMFKPMGYQGVKIIYNSDDAGNVPPPVKLALIVWLSRMIDNSADSGKEAIDVQTDTVRARYVQDKIGSLPDFVKMALDPYRLPAMGRF